MAGARTGSLGILALLLGACTSATDGALPPEVARAVAGRVAAGTPDRMLVVLDAVGDTTMSFATRQGLVTAGFVVQDTSAYGDSTFAVLHFEHAAPHGDLWTVATTKRPGDDDAPSVSVEWTVRCADAGCEVTDSMRRPAQD